MTVVRVLVVDDSATQRQLISAVLASDPSILVVGEAADGEDALAACKRLRPDIVLMDIRMPKVDGYEASRRIMDESPCPIILLTNSPGHEELDKAYRAIEAGALTVLWKPRWVRKNDSESRELVELVKAMSEVRVVRRRAALLTSQSVRLPRADRAPVMPGDIGLIAIGASTGGPPTLQLILRTLGKTELPPIVVVQHMSRGFVPGLVQWLNDTTGLTVKVASVGDSVAPGMVFLAPDDRHLLVSESGRIVLDASPPVGGHRPSITSLFQSVAREYGRHGMGVLLTGMGSDGAVGLQEIRAAAGHTIVQDEESCVVFGMPKEAIVLGAATETLSPEGIADRIRATTSHAQPSTTSKP